MITDKWAHDYVRHYQRLPIPRDVLELGIENGASILLWRHLWPEATLMGVDIRLTRAAHEAAQATGATLIDGDATDVALWATLPVFDVIVDDASHRIADMVRALTLGWPHVRPGGCWVMEDTCCAYWAEYADADLPAFLTGRIHDLHWHGERSHGGVRDRRHYTRAPSNVWEATLDRLQIVNGMVFLHKREDV